MRKTIGIVMCSMLLIGCGPEEEPNVTTDPNKGEKEHVEEPTVAVPDFNKDSAYAFVQKQVDFGPRVPNTPQHDSCGKWLVSKLEGYGFEVMVQEGQAKAWMGKMLNIQNIIAQYNPEMTNRIMLCGHWDTRPYADRDTERQTKPILGANDGASEVGVLLEIARQISLSDPKTGVDIILFDTEDYGSVSVGGMLDIASTADTWCLGSQYWSRNQPIKGYNPRYGILMDMVGAKDAVFYKEGYSMKYAPQQVNTIWKVAENLGYGKYFVKKLAPGITDDHTYVNQIAGIPTLDIVHYGPSSNAGHANFDFGHFHHTHKDNMDIIDAETLKAVGQTVLYVVYKQL